MKLVVGMLAHVDAGKTTLSEGLLFKGGRLRRLGRVDHQDAFLDTDAMERRRGITIFAKQAVLELEGATLTLMDTPGHADLSGEMERTLQILDYAILVVSGAEGIAGHTLTLWQLLERYRIPTFLFINKMDLSELEPGEILSSLRQRLHPGCVAFSPQMPSFFEDVALCGEDALAQFLDTGRVEEETTCDLIAQRQLFPCIFGSALRLEGVEELLAAIRRYARSPIYDGAFGAKVFKITRDGQGNRLTHLKVTGGSLSVRAQLQGGPTPGGEASPSGGKWSEKVSQIRIYSGERFQAVEDALPGTVCAVTGLSHTYPGQGLGAEPSSGAPALEPVLSYRVLLPPGEDPHLALRKLRLLEEEDPQLALSWNEASQEIHLSLMGEIQLEVLQHQLQERFGLGVTFDTGRILYRETIAEPVVGIGHFEPLRHYAEVHLLLEPGPRGSGLRFDTACSEDLLPRNWQNLVLTHLGEREHLGVLAGAPLTDMVITLLTGRAHNRHTEGGDFREATYRAVRQGLMQARSLLLEPWYRFRLLLPAEAVGRAMTDLQQISEQLSLPENDGTLAVLTGAAPVAALRDYAPQIAAYTRGQGRLSTAFLGFAPCLDQEAAITAQGYDPLRDIDNPADSVFCTGGSGVTVPWSEVEEWAHLSSSPAPQGQDGKPPSGAAAPHGGSRPGGLAREEVSALLDKELEQIYLRTYGPAKVRERRPARAQGPRTSPVSGGGGGRRVVYEKPDYLLVDGYNIIHAWEDLQRLSLQSMDAARQALMDMLSNYRGYTDREIILVFDAYRVPGGTGSVNRYHNISVIYTKEAETADDYIEKVTYEMGKRHRVWVATSDGAVQIIIWGHGAFRVTPTALREEMASAQAEGRALLTARRQPGFQPKIISPEEKA